MFVKESFAKYGLDVRKNFLSAPVCKCGCGQKMLMCLESLRDAVGFARAVLEEQECCFCFVGLVPMDSAPRIVIKVKGEEEKEPSILVTKYDGAVCSRNYKKIFAPLDEEFDFHWIGLIVEVEPGSWKIVED